MARKAMYQTAKRMGVGLTDLVQVKTGSGSGAIKDDSIDASSANADRVQPRIAIGRCTDGQNS